MRNLSILSGVVLTVGLALGGCGKKDKLDEALATFEGYKNKVCACKDKACAEKEFEAYKKWEDTMEKELKAAYPDKDKVDKSKMEKFEKIDDDMKDCRRKFRDEAPPPEAPPAP